MIQFANTATTGAFDTLKSADPTTQAVFDHLRTVERAGLAEQAALFVPPAPVEAPTFIGRPAPAPVNVVQPTFVIPEPMRPPVLIATVEPPPSGDLSHLQRVAPDNDTPVATAVMVSPPQFEKAAQPIFAPVGPPQTTTFEPILTKAVESGAASVTANPDAETTAVNSGSTPPPGNGPMIAGVPVIWIAAAVALVLFIRKR